MSKFWESFNAFKKNTSFMTTEQLAEAGRVYAKYCALEKIVGRIGSS